MQWLKYSFITFISVAVTAIIVGVLFLYAGQFLGIVVMIVGVFVLSIQLIWLVIQFVKRNNQMKQVFTFFYIVVTGTLLLSLGAVNYILNDEWGEISAFEKLNVLLDLEELDTAALDELTADYPTLTYEHIVFTYTPKAKRQVEEIIAMMGQVNTIERQIFNGDVKKLHPLEVYVLPSFKEYVDIQPFSSEDEGGSYFPGLYKAVTYYEARGASDENSFLKEIFTHEYGHYLFDMYVADLDLEREEIPVWYDEGISEYMSRLLNDDPGTTAEYSTPLTELWSSSEWNTAFDLDPYAVATNAIEYVVATHSRHMLSSILVDQQETQSFDESFEKLTGMKLATLHTVSERFKEQSEQ